MGSSLRQWHFAKKESSVLASWKEQVFVHIEDGKASYFEEAQINQEFSYRP